MRTVLLLLAAWSCCAQDLPSILARLASYQTSQGRAVPIELEEAVRARPPAEVEPLLIAFLASGATPAAKALVCRHLSVIGTEAAAPALASLLLSEYTVEMARYALERIPGEKVNQVLRDALTKVPLQARPGVVNSLGVRRDPKAVPLLARLTGDEAALAALGRIATPEAIAALRKQQSPAALDALLAAASRQPPAAAFALYRELLALPSASSAVRVAALHGLAASSPDQAIAPLAALLKDPALQPAAISALGRIPRPAAYAALAAAWKTLPPTSRAQAVAAISRRDDARRSPLILEALNDAALPVRLSALEALSWLGDPRLVPSLASTAATADEPEKSAARAALERMPGAAVDQAIVNAITQADPPARLELIRAAGLRGASGAAQLLLRFAASSDPASRREAIRALRECAAAPEIPPALELLQAAQNAAERRDLERALSAALRRSPPDALSHLTLAYRAATAPPLRASLLSILAQSGQTEALPLVEEALDDPSPEIVRAAILGLTEWPGPAPVSHLLAFAARTTNASHQILALRAILRLMELPTTRSASESAGLLASVMRLAGQPEEKKAVLALLPRYASPAALRIAEQALADQTVAQEARIAVERLRRALPQ